MSNIVHWRFRMMGAIEEDLLRAIAAGLALLPQVNRIPIDDAGTAHIVYVTREMRIPSDLAEMATSADFPEECRRVAEAHGCTFERNADGSLTFHKPANGL
jgi:hypothetical protein